MIHPLNKINGHQPETKRTNVEPEFGWSAPVHLLIDGMRKDKKAHLILTKDQANP